MFRTAAALAERLQSILLFTELLLITHQKIQAEVLQDTVDCDQGQTEPHCMLGWRWFFHLMAHRQPLVGERAAERAVSRNCMQRSGEAFCLARNCDMGPNS